MRLRRGPAQRGEPMKRLLVLAVVVLAALVALAWLALQGDEAERGPWTAVAHHERATRSRTSQPSQRAAHRPRRSARVRRHQCHL
jgi:hypothetical protein